MGLTGRVGGGSAATGLLLPGVVAPVCIHELKKKSNKEIKVNRKKMLKQILLVLSYCLPLLPAISLILLIGILSYQMISQVLNSLCHRAVVWMN